MVVDLQEAQEVSGNWRKKPLAKPRKRPAIRGVWAAFSSTGLHSSGDVLQLEDCRLEQAVAAEITDLHEERDWHILATRALKRWLKENPY